MHLRQPFSAPSRLAAQSQQSPAQIFTQGWLLKVGSPLLRSHCTYLSTWEAALPARMESRPTRKPTFAELSSRIASQSSSVVMQSHQLWWQLKASYRPWPPRKCCCFLLGYELPSSKHEMSLLCVHPSLLFQIYRLMSFAYSDAFFTHAANSWVFIW